MKYFTMDEFKCSHTGNVDMDQHFLTMLDELRYRSGFPFVITSGYRDPSHPIEAAKATPGTHARGIAVDIACTDPFLRTRLLRQAFELGFSGIGIAKGFIHVDTRMDEPRCWVYDH